MNITVLGHVCIDKNTSEHSSYVTSGSPAMFMDKIFRQFPDTKTTIITPYGKDFFPFQGPAVLIPNQPTSEKTLAYENITKNTIREQKAYNRDSATPVPLNNEMRTPLALTDILFIAPLLPNYSAEYLQSVIAVTNPQAIKILLPQAYYRVFDEHDRVIKRQFLEAYEILQLVNIVIVSEQDQINMKKELITWVQKHPRLIAVMTMSEKGALALEDGNEIMLPAIPVPQKDIIDSVGSGDIFSAGFAYRYQQTKDIKLAGAFANALARQCLFYTSSEIKIDYPSLP
jgi:bifunctional ADP-heptose synthase (sugar kinase/adenylyltransferase)